MTLKWWSTHHERLQELQGQEVRRLRLLAWPNPEQLLLAVRKNDDESSPVVFHEIEVKAYSTTLAKQGNYEKTKKTKTLLELYYFELKLKIRLQIRILSLYEIVCIEIFEMKPQWWTRSSCEERGTNWANFVFFAGDVDLLFAGGDLAPCHNDPRRISGAWNLSICRWIALMTTQLVVGFAGHDSLRHHPHEPQQITNPSGACERNIRLWRFESQPCNCSLPCDWFYCTLWRCCSNAVRTAWVFAAPESKPHLILSL